MKTEDFYPLAKTLPQGWFSEYDMEAICPALEAIPEEGVYLEVGVHKGLSLAFARTVTKPSVHVIGVDIANSLEWDWFRNRYGWTFLHLPSVQAAEEYQKEGKPIDVLFIDGDHSYEGCLADWNNFSPFVKKGGMVFFHDADATSPGVVKMFNEIGDGWSEKTLYIEKLGGKKTSMASVVKL